MIIAVTRNDETNMIVCQLASSLFNISKKIARIRTKDFLEGKWGKLLQQIEYSHRCNYFSGA